MNKPLVIAHRGASADAPENTLAAFRRAMALRADGIELDVQLTRDGVPVVFHDDSLRRLTGTGGRPGAKTSRELDALRVLGSDEKIPTLMEVLRITRGRIVVQIELKRGVKVEPVVAAVRKARAMRWVILASFEWDLVKKSAKVAPRIPRMLISEGKARTAVLLRQLVTCDAQGISVNFRRLKSVADISVYQDHGFSVWSWTVNEAAVARRLAKWGIDGLIGDNPALLRRQI